MNKNKDYKFLLQNFSNLPKNTQKIILKNADPTFTKQICEICLNISNGNIPLTKRNKKKIEKKQNIIKALGVKKGSFKKKIKYIRQRGGAIVPIIASIAGPIIASLLSQK